MSVLFSSAGPSPSPPRPHFTFWNQQCQLLARRREMFKHVGTEAAPLPPHPPWPLLRQRRHVSHHHLLLPLPARRPQLRSQSLQNPPQPRHLPLQHSLQGLLPLPLPNPFLFLPLLLPHAPTFPFPQPLHLPSLIKACSLSQQGKQLHAHVLKFGFGADVYALNGLVHMYVTFGFLGDARKLFDTMPVRNVVSWTIMISGYSQFGLMDEALDVFELMPEEIKDAAVAWNALIAGFVRSNRFQEAFRLFHRMREEEKVELDKFVAATMLSACTGVGALELGKWIHGYVERSGIELDSKLAATIVDMYCKCGCLEKAFEVFSGLKERSVSSWNCMIGGLAMHGKGEDAIRLFREMVEEMVAPDSVTFVNVLSACAHSGLVEEGRYYFHYMTDVHGIEPAKEHYGCMVDLLARAGRLEEARKVIDEMPMS